MKIYTRDQLAKHNGENGTKAFVAVGGKIYEVSQSEKWPGGVHMKRHRAGMDLTEEILAAPHGKEVLERFEMVGLLEESLKPKPAGLKGKFDKWLNNHPFFRRHPHPAIVHVPVGLFAVLPVFQILAVSMRSEATEWAAYCCLLVGTLFLPPAMVTGYFTWWINYDFLDSPIIHKKRNRAWVALILGVISSILRWYIPGDPTTSKNPLVSLYSILVIALAILVGSIGFLGGKLTFPYEKK